MNGGWSFQRSTMIGDSRVQGLVGANNAGTPNTKYDLKADLVLLRDRTSGQGYIVENTATLTCNLGVNGANGLDTGSQAASTWYHFYFIYNPATLTLALLASTTAPPTGPSLPSGYTAWAYATAIYSSVGAALQTTQVRGSRVIPVAVSDVLSGGAATIETSISLTTVVPSNALFYEVGLGNSASGATTDGGGIVDVTAELRVISGTTFAQVYRSKLSNLTATYATRDIVSSQQLPNVNRTLYYLWTVVNGSTPTLSFGVRWYKIPNGDS